MTDQFDQGDSIAEPTVFSSADEALKFLLTRGELQQTSDGQYVVKDTLSPQQLASQLNEQQTITQNQHESLRKLLDERAKDAEEKARLKAEIELMKQEQAKLQSKSQSADVHKDLSADLLREMENIRKQNEDMKRQREEDLLRMAAEKEHLRIKNAVIPAMRECGFVEKEIETNIEFYVERYVYIDELGEIVSKTNKANTVKRDLELILEDKPYLRKPSTSGGVGGNTTSEYRRTPKKNLLTKAGCLQTIFQNQPSFTGGN